MFIAKLGKIVKGFVHHVLADSLAAHSIAGFVEKIFADIVQQKIQTFKKKEVKSREFCVRN